jgi:hypothetical protein
MSENCARGTRITKEKIAAFTEAMRTNIMTGDTPFRRAYIRSVVDQVEVDDTETQRGDRIVADQRLEPPTNELDGKGPAQSALNAFGKV